jgi:predicted transcriptional regulator
MTDRKHESDNCGNVEAENLRTQFNNQKRTYDEYQQVSLDMQRKLNDFHMKIVSDAQQHDNTRQTIANQALQNAVETANMVGKQAVRHADIAIDHQWNPVQQGLADVMAGRAGTIDDVALKGIGAAAVKAVTDALSNNKE